MTEAAVSPEAPAVCPYQPGKPSPGAAPSPTRPLPDRVMRRILFISNRPDHTTDQQVYRLFSTSILVSATRCLLSYVIFPIFAPAIDAATGAGPVIGLSVGSVALVFDVLSIRRFWLADHRWRWPMTLIYVCVIALVSTLLVRDLTRVFG